MLIHKENNIVLSTETEFISLLHDLTKSSENEEEEALDQEHEGCPTSNVEKETPTKRYKPEKRL